MDGIEKKKFRFSKLADVKSVYIKRCIGLGLWGWSLGWVSGWSLGLVFGVGLWDGCRAGRWGRGIVNVLTDITLMPI
jgi:hypothetical protein